MSYDRYLASQELKEELEMEAEEVREATRNALADNYVKYLLSDFVTFFGGTEHEYEDSVFHYDVWSDWLDSIDSNLIELVRLNLLAGEPEKAGQAMVESLQEYMREIALQAVRDKEG